MGDGAASIESGDFEPGIGPHEDRELELMLAGKKPLAMFVEVVPTESGLIPEKAFEPYVLAGQILMREVYEAALPAPSLPPDARLRLVLYALPSEAWRIEAMLLVCQVYDQQGGWDEGLERVTGKLLGYEDWQVEAFLRRVGLRK